MASLISHLVGDREFEIWQKSEAASRSLSNKLLLPTAIAKERLPFHLNFAFRPFLGVIITFYPLTSSHSTVQESDTVLFHDKFLSIGIFYMWIPVHLVKQKSPNHHVVLCQLFTLPFNHRNIVLTFQLPLEMDEFPEMSTAK